MDQTLERLIDLVIRQNRVCHTLAREVEDTRRGVGRMVMGITVIKEEFDLLHRELEKLQ